MPLPNRRHRTSLPTSPGADDVSGLSLAECRDRLARNERVLNSSIFSPTITSPSSTPSPAQSLSTSPTSSFLPPPTYNATSSHQFGHGQGSGAIPGPSRPSPLPAASGPPQDPVKEKLLLTRQALLAREQELLMAQSTDQIAKMEVGSPGSPSPLGNDSARRFSGSGMNGNGRGGSRSGKAMAMEYMRQNDAKRASNGIILPLDETFKLAGRDFDNQTAQSFSSLSLQRPYPPDGSRRDHNTPTKSSSRSRAPPDPLDENARAQHLARMTAFMSYKGDPDLDADRDDDDFGFDFDDPDVMEGAEGEYADESMGSGLVDGYGVKRERGTGEEVDGLGENDERWMDGNDDYEGMGGNRPGAEGGLERVR